jgi:hypothetical protein
MRCLDAIAVPYHVVVDEAEYDRYAAVIPADRLLVLDPRYRSSYETCDDLGEEKSLGPGPARNFVWEHAITAGAGWHWVMDDNIWRFYRLNRNAKHPIADGTAFRVMEDFCLRYSNVGMAGPNYEHFAPRRQAKAPFQTNVRIYSCNLIRNDLPLRWRGRYNEDTDLSLRILKSGLCTILFNAFLQNKVRTQAIPGGNTAEFYAWEGTLPKSRLLVDMHPDVAELAWRFNRWHHQVDYSRFQLTRLIRREDAPAVSSGPDEYGMRLAAFPAGRPAS